MVDAVLAALGDVVEAAGRFWLIAATVFLLAAAAEAAKPAEVDIERGAVGVLAGATALLGPLFLLLHAFWAVAPHRAETDGPTFVVSVIALVPSQTLIALGAIAVVLLIGPSLLGALLGRVPAVGGALYRASPWLNVAALALTLYVTHRSVFDVVQLALNRPD